MEPLSQQSFLVSKDLLPYPEIFGSMDRGCSLSKFLYRRQVPGDSDKVSLEMVFFSNKDFDAGLQWLVARMKEENVTSGQFRVTGVGGEMYRQAVEEATGLHVEFLDEFVSHAAGGSFLVSNFDDDVFCYPQYSGAEVPTDQLPDWIQRLVEKSREQFSESIGKRLPAIFCFSGSAIGFNVLHEDSSLEMLGATMLGGRSLMGMSRILLNTSNYDELMSLAAVGDQRNVDTVAGEVIAQGDNAEFRGLPPDTPLFPMGKAADAEVAEFAKEDLAASIVACIATNMLAQVLNHCKYKRIAQVYVGGHLFKSETARIAFHKAAMMNIDSMGIIKFSFVSNGHTACIGSMLMTKAEAVKRRAEMRMD